MSNEIIEIQDNVTMSPAQVKQQIQTIQEILRDPSIMQEDVHYGKIPGCGDKPALFKPGAEKIMATFRLAPRYEVNDFCNSDEKRYRITTNLFTPDGKFVGSGIGECSSHEAKYMWRASVCDEEYALYDSIGKARIKFTKGWNGKPAQKTKQVRTDPADIANTVLKMAKKRSCVDAVLTTTAASDIFAQDIEDMPEEMRPVKKKAPSKPQIKEPQAQTSTPKTGSLSAPQIKRYWAIFHQSGMTEQERLDMHYDIGIESIQDFDKASYDEICTKMEAKK